MYGNYFAIISFEHILLQENKKIPNEKVILKMHCNPNVVFIEKKNLP